jgi:hypothetical protein
VTGYPRNGVPARTADDRDLFLVHELAALHRVWTVPGRRSSEKMLGATVRLHGAEESHLNGCYGMVESIDSARASIRLEPPDGEAAGRLLVLSLRLSSVEQVCCDCKGCGSSLSVCTQCRKAWYCSKTCQKVQ